MATSRCFPYRPHDYIYDPIFTVAGPTDHYKAAVVAKMSTAKFQICPIFPNMFSELKNYPSVQLVRRKQAPIPEYKPKSSQVQDPALIKKVDVSGADRAKFFYPIINFPPKDLPYMQFPTFTIEKYEKPKSKAQGKKNVYVETKYRESAAQTIPWEPPYTVVGEGDPEILKLEFLKWGSGLPAGVHEVQLIERARMKAAWEKAMKPDVSDPNSLNQFRDYLEALERDEWAFREQEIQEIQDLRLELLEKMLNEIHDKSKIRTEMKLRNFMSIIQAEKEEQISKLRKKTSRELRKLEVKSRGLRTRYHAVNIIAEHVDKKSEIYGPLMRHGEHPKRWHQVIDERMKKYRAQFIGVEQFSTLPRWLDQATRLKKCYTPSKLPGTRLCIRETKWSAPVLKELHEELKNFRKEIKKRPCSLRKRIEEVIEESYTPEVEGIPPQEEEKYQSLVTLQSIIRGRATQMMIYEGRDTCKELIQELKYSVGLLKKEKELLAKEKLRVKAQQREESMQLNMVENLQGTLGKLQGSVVGTLLDFLNKELRRLLEERKAHAMCLLNERERYIREAAEAGRRQKEIRRRREHDEIFKQIVKVTQDSVDIYLQDIITEGMEFASKEEGTDYILKLANKIDRETEEAYEESAKVDIDEQDETIADLLHHFVLPEVQKMFIRKRIRAQQKQNLKTVHEAIHHKIEHLPKIGGTMESDEGETEVFDTVVPGYQDQYEQYLLHIAEETEMLDHVPPPPKTNVGYGHYGESELLFRNDDLDTITEVDSENTSFGEHVGDNLEENLGRREVSEVLHKKIVASTAGITTAARELFTENDVKTCRDENASPPCKKCT